ncbi:MAG: hypothetical protein ITG06_05185 [Planococcus sp. (in: Bacteria)]|nr:hypothetical protein [Planococcus sp. (in: firmicutes)]
MNERLMEFLLRSEVAKLSEKKRRLYQFVIDSEDSLAQKANTADEFRQLLVQHSPYDLAAKRFNLSYDQLLQSMNDIETELNEKISIRCKKVKWIDYSNAFSQSSNKDDNKRVFLFLN